MGILYKFRYSVNYSSNIFKKNTMNRKPGSVSGQSRPLPSV